MCGKTKISVDVIVPVYRPGEKFTRLLKMLSVQTVPVGKLILINTEETLWTEEAEALIKALSAADNALGTIALFHIKKAEFDHAATRRFGVSQSDAEVFVCMTDDAVPENEELLARLLEGLCGTDAEKTCAGSDGGTAALSYARQLADKDCREAERFTRRFNYPEHSFTKGKEDLPRLGIKTYFASNVCCAYRRGVYDSLGGFCENAIFNEDMLYAEKVISAGYRIAYCAEARVVHSHNYGGLQQFHRNFDLGVSQAMHPEVFSGLPSEGEGLKLVKQTAGHLIKGGYIPALWLLFWQSGMKYLGYRCGKAYRKLPYALVHAFAMNKTYVEKHLKKGARLTPDP